MPKPYAGNIVTKKPTVKTHRQPAGIVTKKPTVRIKQRRSSTTPRRPKTSAGRAPRVAMRKRALRRK